MSYLCLTVRLHQPLFHGQRDGGEPEWPPSPLRLYQSLVAAAAAQTPDGDPMAVAGDALQWLERQPAPAIIAAKSRLSVTPYRMYVPNNTADLAASSWSRGATDTITARVEKDIRPLHLIRPADLTEPVLHYLYDIGEAPFPYLEILGRLARSITHLGWGIDQAFGNATLHATMPASQAGEELWLPVIDPTATQLRVPIKGSLLALSAKHGAFLNRLKQDLFHPVPPLTAFQLKGYRPDSLRQAQPFAAFQILTIDGSRMRLFDTTQKSLVVAGMLRHLAGQAAQESRWSDAKISSVIFGHATLRNSNGNQERHVHQHNPQRQESQDIVGPDRLAYLPLPSIEFRGQGLSVGSVRRVLITTFGQGCFEEVAWTRRALNGRDLISEHNGHATGMMASIPNSEKMVQRYTNAANTWATVTPVILPGRDDRNPRKAEKLIRKALLQAGFTEFLAQNAELELRNVSFWPGSDLASHFRVPKHLEAYPRYHVRLKWPALGQEPLKLPGVLCIGGGRHYGLGLFAAERVSE
ncbi:CRISPR-associated protein, GSU0054 family [Planctopirus limnophila DSM 3776]|uniref:CRISPR-associated protein, GSU0054 family n=1 Tax=Planctopirus limnophila (strain ATCC 43296 / DSM 3776 / IFAM 1008 / Mu 290) TaxID=521674 RepID=D5STD6_PLAL2|nr:type I-U CRISPR-associated protein Csb2 [Planctopirus limnophila]ADG68965.1 CRISPR-associated protein, GSU0054 family [Planctopirus limnophila DSM 3776]